MPELRDLRVHTCAMNARDVETLATQAEPDAACICDGEWVGEGPDAVRRALQREFAVNEELFARLGTVDGEAVILEFDAVGEERASLRFRGEPGNGRFRELRIDHRRPRVVAPIEPQA